MDDELTARLDLITSLLVPGARVLRWRELRGGISAETVTLTYRAPDTAEHTVVVRFMSAASLRWSLSAAQHYELLVALHVRGLPVPRPLAFHDADTLFPDAVLVLEYVTGQVHFEAASPTERARAMGASLADIHATAVDGLPPVLSGATRAAGWIGAGADSDERPSDHHSPLARRALGRVDLTTRAGNPCLLHGDFWPGNLLWRGEQLAAVIDWEEAMLGDPLLDVAIARLELSWCWGAASARAFTDAYRGYTQLDLARLPYWDLVAALRPGSGLALWAEPWAHHGRPDITAGTMSQARREFVERALTAIGVTH
jgi:aminoglycoside phosphotransferase (APT) family kinase protein